MDIWIILGIIVGLIILSLVGAVMKSKQMKTMNFGSGAQPGLKEETVRDGEEKVETPTSAVAEQSTSEAKED
ncbi:MAG: hypothetical protein LBH63_02090 [Clostridiales Family XIII bacterium]|jgi:hypothetical protein|nr:hypothetical protein [Clostridiales Family XIII bacterium]